MRETTISILGFALTLRYTVYEGGHIEWKIGGPAYNESLLNTMLRIHYTEYINAELRKIWFEEEYAQHQINSAQISLGFPDVDF